MKALDPGSKGYKLRKMRRERGYGNVVDFAVAVGVDRSTINKIELNAENGSRATWEKISETLNVPLDYFLGQPIAAGVGNGSLSEQGPYLLYDNDELALIRLWRDMPLGFRQTLFQMLLSAAALLVDKGRQADNVRHSGLPEGDSGPSAP